MRIIWTTAKIVIILNAEIAKRSIIKSKIIVAANVASFAKNKYIIKKINFAEIVLEIVWCAEI